MIPGVDEARLGKTIEMDALLGTGAERIGQAARLLLWGKLSRNVKHAWTLTRRDGPFCSYCGAELDDSNRTIDHVEPKSRGGSFRLGNLRLCCKRCNQLKGAGTVLHLQGQLGDVATAGSGSR